MSKISTTTKFTYDMFTCVDGSKSPYNYKKSELEVRNLHFINGLPRWQWEKYINGKEWKPWKKEENEGERDLGWVRVCNWKFLFINGGFSIMEREDEEGVKKDRKYESETERKKVGSGKGYDGQIYGK